MGATRGRVGTRTSSASFDSSNVNTNDTSNGRSYRGSYGNSDGWSQSRSHSSWHSGEWSRSGRDKNDWQEEKWEWDDYIKMKGSTVDVTLTACDLNDSDIEDLLYHLKTSVGVGGASWKSEMVVNIDLSCNWGITDFGVETQLVPFLEQHPNCHRLKLYKTSIGDLSLSALIDWISDGYVRELHLSDLGRPVSSKVLLSMMRAIKKKGNYPYQNRTSNSKYSKCPLWCRLEHNGVPESEVDDILRRLDKDGFYANVLDKRDTATVRPGVWEDEDAPAVNLVLFRKQQLRIEREPFNPKSKRAASEGQKAKDRERERGRSWQNSWDGTSSTDAWGHDDRMRNHSDAAGSTEATPPIQEQEMEHEFERADVAAEAAVEARIIDPEAVQRAMEIVDACEAPDATVHNNWHRHLMSSPNPEREATRIMRMMMFLTEQQYFGTRVADIVRDEYAVQDAEQQYFGTRVADIVRDEYAVQDADADDVSATVISQPTHILEALLADGDFQDGDVDEDPSQETAEPGDGNAGATKKRSNKISSGFR
eukprot:TRINITY_DN7290_c0_g1_i2.p1 TRINITY_DN7290_c0_g1~~TRINITY_DN7290_c0_g1_i2.p1  ORF type:complete len:567 (+),score=87.32 TRINITY_DN7290_c0_g1_i2:91-1701(+)